jgi:hypothetical protein
MATPINRVEVIDVVGKGHRFTIFEGGSIQTLDGVIIFECNDIENTERSFVRSNIISLTVKDAI